MGSTIQQLHAGNTLVSDSARSHTEQNLRAFRFMLNERAWTVQGSGESRSQEVATGSEAVLAVQARNHARSGQAGYHNGYPTEFGSGKRKPSDRRPESANVIWKTYVDDYMLVLVAKTSRVVETVETSAGSTTVERDVTKYWVTMAEWQTASIETDADLARVNAEYFQRQQQDGTLRGIPLVYRSKKGWRVIEPFGEWLGVYTSADEAEDHMRKWADELRIDASFHDDSGWDEVIGSDRTDIPMGPALKARVLAARA